LIRQFKNRLHAWAIARVAAAQAVSNPLPNWRNEEKTITPAEAVAAIRSVIEREAGPAVEESVSPEEKLVCIMAVFGALEGEIAKAIALEGDNRRFIAHVTGKRAWEF